MKTEEKQNHTQIVNSSKKNLFFERSVGTLEKCVYKLNSFFHKISAVLLFLLMFLTTADVIGRYFFNRPITGVYELTGLILAINIFFSLGMAQMKRDHIEIDFLTKKFSAIVQTVLIAITSLILLVLMILTTWQLLEYGGRIYSGNETSGDLGIPLYIFVYLAVVGAVCFTLTFLIDFLNAILKVVKHNES